MQQNTLSTTLGVAGGDGGGDGAIQDLEVAGRMVDKHLNYDSSFPSLLDMLRVTPQTLPSVSGLSETDYPSSGDARTARHLHTTRKVPLPSELMHHFQHMQCNCMMGLFPEINRAWLTIDSDIYVWVYEDGSDLAYFDGLHETILSVGLVKPKKGVFKSYIEHLLCLTTTSEIVLLGVSFSQSPVEGSSGMHLLPEPLFSVPADGSYIITITGTADGRVFMGAKDGCLYELVYQAEDGWFTRKCQKVNHTRSTISYILPFLSFSEDDPINQVEVDDTRHILYTLSDRGTITVYDLDCDGKNTSRVVSVPHNNIMNAALQAAKTVDKSNFKGVVSLCPINTDESPHIHLVVVTGTGVRLYYTTVSLIGGTNQRPSQLLLLHVRLPPGFAANATVYRPTKVHKALYSHGTGVLCSNESNEADTVWTMSSDQYPYHPTLAESQSTHAVDGYVWALADVTPQLWCSALNPPTTLGTRPPLLVTQHQQAPRQLVLLSANGAHILTFQRPVDQLRQLLEEAGGPESSIIKEFFSAMTPTQACATALILATDPSNQNAQVAEWATHALFLYGANAHSAATVSTPSVFPPQTPTMYNFQPTQVSTPVIAQNTTVIQDSQFSPLHNALYLYMARILRPAWGTPVAKETTVEGKPVMVSTMNAEEVGFLADKVELLAKFLLTSQGTTAMHPLNASSSSLNITRYASDSSERASLSALRSLLGQTLEVLRLLTLLTTHNFNTITSAIQKEVREQLGTMSLRDLILNGREVCRALIMALLDRYHGDNASADAISNRLRNICPNLYRIEDAKLAKANEIILAAKASNVKAEKEKGFKEAVAICKQIGHHVNVSGISSQLASGGAYEAVVDLCLSVASQRDPTGIALHYYKNNEPAEDHQGYMAFTSRMECYRVIMDQLNQLVGAGVAPPSSSPSVPARPGPPTPPPSTLPSTDATQYANQMMNLIVSSNDELANVTLYQWLVDTNRTDRLLALTSPYLESFLTRSNGQAPLHQLLWRYYERNQDYFKAAKTLLLLAEQIGDTPVNVRVEYLSRAIMCLSSCEMNTASSYADFMLHLEEKKAVTRVQLMVLDALQSDGASADVIAQLNSSLLNLTILYEKFAEPWALWECKLAIVHCAGHSEPQLVQVIWSKIIETELERTQSAPLETRIDSLASKIKALARVYSINPNYFPLEHIIKECEIKSVQLKVQKPWVVTALQGCGILISKLINIYHKLYRSGDSIWEVERSPFHLLGVSAHLISMLIENSGSIQPSQKRALREQCLDYVAEYITEVGASADPSAGVIFAHLKSCQAQLERFL